MVILQRIHKEKMNIEQGLIPMKKSGQADLTRLMYCIIRV
jgi:hypothetical protein